MLRRIFCGFAPTTVVLLLFIAPLNVNAHNQRDMVGGKVPAETVVRKQSSVAGTYALAICASNCDSRQPKTAVRVTLVLFDANLDMGRLLPAERRDVQRSYAINLDLDNSAPPNACYVIDTFADSAGGLPSRAYTRWRRLPSDSLRIDLFHGPDAGYFLQLKIRADIVSGLAAHWSVREGGRNTADSVRGKRLRDADVHNCSRTTPPQ